MDTSVGRTSNRNHPHRPSLSVVSGAGDLHALLLTLLVSELQPAEYTLSKGSRTITARLPKSADPDWPCDLASSTGAAAYKHGYAPQNAAVCCAPTELRRSAKSQSHTALASHASAPTGVEQLRRMCLLHRLHRHCRTDHACVEYFVSCRACSGWWADQAAGCGEAAGGAASVE